MLPRTEIKPWQGAEPGHDPGAWRAILLPWDQAPALTSAIYWGTLPMTCGFQLWFAWLKSWKEHQGSALAWAHLPWSAQCGGWLRGNVPWRHPSKTHVYAVLAISAQQRRALAPTCALQRAAGFNAAHLLPYVFAGFVFYLSFPKRAYVLHKRPMSLSVLLLPPIPIPNQTFLSLPITLKSPCHPVSFSLPLTPTPAVLSHPCFPQSPLVTLLPCELPGCCVKRRESQVRIFGGAWFPATPHRYSGCPTPC